MGRRAHGKNAPDVTIRVPPGTVVRAHPGGEFLGELMEADARLVVARGGRGGRGNVHFASATHRAPKHAEKGTPGAELWVELELKLIADIGLVGAPNAGKSTLLAALTEARPEVGAYPFTTITPNLGVMALDEDHTAVIADVPGLIEGAHEGRGLGHHFLRHVERTRVIVGVIDGAAREPLEEWRAVADELRLHDPALMERPMPLVVTKLDLPEVRERWPELRAALAADGIEPLAVSAHDGTGLEELRASARRRAGRGSHGRGGPPGRRGDAGPSLRSAGGGLGGGRRGRRLPRARSPHRAARQPAPTSRTRSRATGSGACSSGWASISSCVARAPGEGTTVHIGPIELDWGDED